MNIKNAAKLVIMVVICLLAGFISGFSTSSTTNMLWYNSLNRPFFTPPNWVFGPAWTILYILMGIAAYIIWKQRLDNKSAKKALAWFFLQLFLNALWSPIFFGFHAIPAAFIEMIILWLAILHTIVLFRKVSQIAALLLLPYIIWVSFAAFLNASIWIMNQ